MSQCCGWCLYEGGGKGNVGNFLWAGLPSIALAESLKMEMICLSIKVDADEELLSFS